MRGTFGSVDVVNIEQWSKDSTSGTGVSAVGVLKGCIYTGWPKEATVRFDCPHLQNARTNVGAYDF